MRSLFPFVAIVAATLACGACGDDGDPLGGPYGGTTSNPGPSGGTSGSSSSGTQDVSGGDGGSASTKDGGSVVGKDGGSSGGSDSGTSGGAPTWTDLFNSYLASGTEGNCGASGCHSQMRSPSAAYSWLQGKHQINGTSSALGDPSSSILSWMGGGSMPPHGPTSDATAESGFEAWTAAGAPNN